jgi:hypothetical protein
VGIKRDVKGRLRRIGRRSCSHATDGVFISTNNPVKDLIQAVILLVCP